MGSVSWANAKHTCPGCGAAKSPLKDSDFAARRLLQGLGLSSATLHEAELLEFEQNYADESQWSRGVRLWTTRAHSRGLKYLKFETGPAETPESARFWDEDGNAGDTNWRATAYVFRDSDECYVHVAVARDTAWLSPPFAVTKSINGLWLVRMRLLEFTKATTTNE